jgi:hypothetical protein
MADIQDLKARAEAVFRSKSDEGGDKASDQYEVRCRTIAEKTKRLRELRLAKEAAQRNNS